jgi:hypothetical protein
VFRNAAGEPIPFEAWVRLHPSERAPAPARMTLGPDPVNPPEAPPESADARPVAPPKTAARVVVPAGSYDAMDRASLKALAIERGLCTSGFRKGEDALRDLLRAADQTAASGAIAGTATHAHREDMVPAALAAIGADRALAEADEPPPVPDEETLSITIAGPVMPEEERGGWTPSDTDEAIRKVRALLDRMNATRREMDALEADLHALLGVA